MYPSRKFKESFNKVLKTYTDLLLPVDDLQEAYNQNFDKPIGKEICKDIRENTIKYFTSTVVEEFNKICDELEVEEKFFKKQNLVAEQKNLLPSSGWRPSGNAEKDTFGDKRQIQLNHIKNLRSLNDELEEHLKKSKKALEKEHKILKAECTSNI
uniref:Uncharacterized protein n=1 Tax=Panagrolaimus sp. PS1159 TaxID=55785 RepID=A0AC35G9G7_9BILA